MQSQRYVRTAQIVRIEWSIARTLTILSRREKGDGTVPSLMSISHFTHWFRLADATSAVRSNRTNGAHRMVYYAYAYDLSSHRSRHSGQIPFHVYILLYSPIPARIRDVNGVFEPHESCASNGPLYVRLRPLVTEQPPFSSLMYIRNFSLISARIRRTSGSSCSRTSSASNERFRECSRSLLAEGFPFLFLHIFIHDSRLLKKLYYTSHAFIMIL